MPAGTSAKVECQSGGASPVGETRLALLLFSDPLAESAGNGLSVSGEEDRSLHLTEQYMSADVSHCGGG